MDRTNNLAGVLDRTEPWDIVVIGGGATGVGCALDAASRGYDVLLLEQHDLGKGTSSRSTKLVHGGVRYLKQGNFSLVREALRERGILLLNAPHVVHKQAFIVPCYSLYQKLYYILGLKLYDLMSGKYSLGPSRLLSRDETLERLPTITKVGLAGGVLYFDGQFDDTRLLIDLAQAAEAKGAAILNYARVVSIEKNAAGRVTGVSFADALTDVQISAKSRVIINATGTFGDHLREMSVKGANPILTMSQGIHLVLDRSFLPSESAIMIPKTSDGRVLFCIPWHEHVLIGTTDTAVSGPTLEPKALASEIDFVLETAGEYLEKKPTTSDILSVFAGIRPLVKLGTAKNTSKLSRGHMIEIDAAGMLTVTGGKWTTYRHMAEDAVDQAARIGGLALKRSVTSKLPINGPPATHHGDDDRLHSDLPVTECDILRGVRTEMAQTLEDVLARRTRALFLNAMAAIEIAPQVAAIMAKEMGKDNAWRESEVAAFCDVARNYLSPKT